jgi:hypothetical protein
MILCLVFSAFLLAPLFFILLFAIMSFLICGGLPSKTKTGLIR